VILAIVSGARNLRERSSSPSVEAGAKHSRIVFEPFLSLYSTVNPLIYSSLNQRVTALII